jgi:hypothetical protein
MGGTGNDLVLIVPASPFLDADFDEDLDVDGDDLARWQANFSVGATHVEGDADYDCDVDGADFLTWQRQLGSPATAEVSMTTLAGVPEPTAACLMLAAASLFMGAAGRANREQPAVGSVHCDESCLSAGLRGSLPGYLASWLQVSAEL